ncbi:MAG: hypothetical protein MUP85_18940 [Candidatus Lokiarchaeota archaeon]|nr:hypothetical protein [Candidatus Lokiarchaeota archaeon]
MKPPICCICHNRLKDMDKSRLIYFKETEADKKWKKRMEDEGMVGHPPYAEWFCEEHYQEAYRLKEKSKSNALKILKEIIP